MKKQVNQNLKNITNWLNENNIWLNIRKAEVVLFKSLMGFHGISMGRLYPTSSVKYLSIKIDENLNWKQQISDIAVKLNRANTILSKLRHYRHKNSEFNLSCTLCYSSLVCAPNLNSVLQKKSSRIIYFRSCNAHTSLLLRESNTLKLPDKIALGHCLFINKYFNKFLPTIFKNCFTFSSDFHASSTRWSNLGSLVVPPRNTNLYGRN